MELVFFTMLNILILSALVTPCASLQIQVQPSNNQVAANKELQVSLPTLPRKLRFLTEKVTVDVEQEGNKDSAPYTKHKETVNLAGGNKQIFHKQEEEKEEGGVQRSRSGTWKEWMEREEEDTSQFFTMDYTRVRRRRPIHNKSQLHASP